VEKRGSKRTALIEEDKQRRLTSGLTETLGVREILRARRPSKIWAIHEAESPMKGNLRGLPGGSDANKGREERREIEKRRNFRLRNGNKKAGGTSRRTKEEKKGGIRTKVVRKNLGAASYHLKREKA